MNRWEHFPHVADLGVRGMGATLEEAFSQAALALSGAVCDPQSIEERQAVHFQCEEADRELLLVDWLNAVIYEMAVRKMLFCRYEVQIRGAVLLATAWGEAVDRARHEPAVEIKAATYTELKVYRTENGSWLAQCVIDV